MQQGDNKELESTGKSPGQTVKQGPEMDVQNPGKGWSVRSYYKQYVTHQTLSWEALP